MITFPAGSAYATILPNPCKTQYGQRPFLGHVWACPLRGGSLWQGNGSWDPVVPCSCNDLKVLTVFYTPASLLIGACNSRKISATVLQHFKGSVEACSLSLYHGFSSAQVRITVYLTRFLIFAICSSGWFKTSPQWNQSLYARHKSS